MTEIKSKVADELLDEDLKMILGKRYQDTSHLFTPEAQERRRNNRLVFTLRIMAFMACMIFFISWAKSMGFMSDGQFGLWMVLCGSVVGYNAGVCVSHMKGWRD